MTDVPPGPGARVDLTWDLWCDRHLAPYRPQWPSGAGVAMMRLFDAAVKMPAVADAAGHDAANLTAALRRFAPLCCFISREDMQAIYDETVPLGPGPVRRSLVPLISFANGTDVLNRLDVA